MAPSPTTQEPNPVSKAMANPIHPDFLDQLDSDFVEFYNTKLGRTTPDNSAPLEEVRKQRAKYHSRKARNFSQAQFVEDIILESEDGHKFTVRLYKPDPRSSPYGVGPYPVHINFHGKPQLIEIN